MIWPWTRYASELREINKIRKRLGYAPITKLPKGQRNNASYCPVAKALDHGRSSVGRTRWLVWTAPDTDGTKYMDGPLPPALQRFVDDFDIGEYPDLIE